MHRFMFPLVAFVCSSLTRSTLSLHLAMNSCSHLAKVGGTGVGPADREAAESSRQHEASSCILVKNRVHSKSRSGVGLTDDSLSSCDRHGLM